MDGSRDLQVDATNTEQAQDWNGEDGEYWASHRTEYERLLEVFDAHLLDAADIQPDDRVLEIGCGAGATSRALAHRAVAGTVLGIDLSGPMLELARQSAPPNVQYLHADAQIHGFAPASFDVAVSRFGCMFFGEPAVAFANVGRALRPDGRLALAVWQDKDRNRWITVTDEALSDGLPAGEAPAEEPTQGPPPPGPFSMADPARCRSLLQEAGFVDIAVDPLEVPLQFGSPDQAEALLATWMDDDLDDAGRARVTRALRQLIADTASDTGVLLESATWLVTARRPA